MDEKQHPPASQLPSTAHSLLRSESAPSRAPTALSLAICSRPRLSASLLLTQRGIVSALSNSIEPQLHRASDRRDMHLTSHEAPAVEDPAFMTRIYPHQQHVSTTGERHRVVSIPRRTSIIVCVCGDLRICRNNTKDRGETDVNERVKALTSMIASYRFFPCRPR